MESKTVPCEAYLYRYSSSVVKQAAHIVLAKQGIKPTMSFNGDYCLFNGKDLDSTILANTNIVFWTEDFGSEKSTLLFSAFNTKTKKYVAAIKDVAVLDKIKKTFSRIEYECVDVSNQLFIADQNQKVSELDKEVNKLQNDLQRLETYTPNATMQINQLKSSLRLKKLELAKETDVLERLRHASSF
ncbi:MAG: hypothetical protein LBU91_07005 [Bacteroidales bacterium]|nr:hypothetical protein [Bacteroidales bacterium]